MKRLIGAFIFLFLIIVFTGCSKLELEDSVSVKQLIRADGTQIAPSDFVEGLPSSVSVDFKKTPDTTKTGTKKVKLVFTADGKSKTVSTQLTVFRLTRSLTAEKGSEGIIDISELVTDKKQREKTAFSQTEWQVRTDECGERIIEVSCDGVTYDITVSVVDTTPPQAEPNDGIEVYVDFGDEAMAFLKNASDASNIEARFAEEPDFSTLGSAKTTVILSDEYDNSSTYEVNYKVINDRVNPLFIGLDDINIKTGEDISYTEDVLVVDNRDGLIDNFNVDTSKVDAFTAGTYYAKYTATDSAGNTTTKKRKIIVTEKELTEVEMYCKKVIASIIKTSMSHDEKIKAVWKWTKNNIIFFLRNVSFNMIKKSLTSCPSCFFAGFTSCKKHAKTVANPYVHTVAKPANRYSP